MSSLKIKSSQNNYYFQLNPNALYQFSNFTFSPEQELLFQGDKIINLGQKSIQCLILLIANANRIVKKDYFFETVWEDKFVEDGVLNVNIWQLRKVLGRDCIQTFPQRGYKFTQEVTEIKSEDNQNFLFGETSTITKSNFIKSFFNGVRHFL